MGKMVNFDIYFPTIKFFLFGAGFSVFQWRWNSVLEKIVVAEGIEELWVLFNTQRCIVPNLVKISFLTIIFLIKLKYFLHHSQNVTPPHFWWAETQGPLLTMGTMTSPLITPLLNLPRALRLAGLFPALPVGILFLAPLLCWCSCVFSPSRPPPTLKQAGECFIFLSVTGFSRTICPF